MKKCRQSEILPKSASSRNFYKKVPPVGALIKKCCQSEILPKSAVSRSSYEKGKISDWQHFFIRAPTGGTFW